MSPVLKSVYRDSFFRVVVHGFLVNLLVMLLLLGSNVLQAAEVNVYSGRKEALIRPVLDRFTAYTGIAVNLVSGKAGQLRERLLVEGRNTPADVLITADVANLHRSMVAGLLQPIESDVLEKRIPVTYDRTESEELSTYEDLPALKWRNRIVVRSSSNVYNQSLIASMIAVHGVEAAELWARGLVENFARSPKGGDTDQIRAVAAGEADIAIVNSYYYGRLVASSKKRDQEVIKKTALFFPNQDGRGTHVNVSGAGVTAHAKNRSEAILLLEFLASSEGQRLFAELNHEYPVSKNVERSPIVFSWGPFKADQLNLALLGEHNGDAIRLADRAGWR